MLLSGDRAGLERYFSLPVSPAAAGGGHRELAAVADAAGSPMDKIIKEMELAGAG